MIVLECSEAKGWWRNIFSAVSAMRGLSLEGIKEVINETVDLFYEFSNSN